MLLWKHSDINKSIIHFVVGISFGGSEEWHMFFKHWMLDFIFSNGKKILKICQIYYTSFAVATTSNNMILTVLPFLLILDNYQEFRHFETNPFFCPQMLQCEIVSSVCLVGRCNYAYECQSQAAWYFWYFLTHPITYCTMLVVVVLWW